MKRWQWGVCIVALLGWLSALTWGQVATYPKYRVAGGASGNLIAVNGTGQMQTTGTAPTATVNPDPSVNTFPIVRLSGSDGRLVEVNSNGQLAASVSGALDATNPLLIPSSTASTPGIASAVTPTSGIFTNAGGGILVSAVGNTIFHANSNYMSLSSYAPLGWSSADAASTGMDVALRRGGVGLLQVDDPYNVGSLLDFKARRLTAGTNVLQTQPGVRLLGYSNDPLNDAGAGIELGDGSSNFLRLARSASNSYLLNVSSGSSLAVYVGGSLRLSIDNNGPFSPSRFTSNVFAWGTGVAFTAIGGYIPNKGDSVMCSDCTRTASCAGSGTGAIAKNLTGSAPYACD